MKKNGRITLLVLTVFLSGCQGLHAGKKSTVTPVPGKPVAAGASVIAGATPPAASDGVRKQLATCLFEAEQLVKLNAGKYRGMVNTLYEDIHTAKYYASVAGNLSATTTDTITPLYQYRVNDTCNTISQALLGELKQGSAVKGPQA